MSPGGARGDVIAEVRELARRLDDVVSLLHRKLDDWEQEEGGRRWKNLRSASAPSSWRPSD